MGKRFLRLTALALVLCLLLSGCGFGSLFRLLPALLDSSTSFRDMEYIRPDLEAMEQALSDCEALSRSAKDADSLMEAVYEFYDLYDLYYTSYVLADIHYSCDLTDTFWEEAYTFCAGSEPAVEAMLEQLFHTLAQSPLREELEKDSFFGDGFFDDYDREPALNKKLVALLEREADLENEYYDLRNQYSVSALTENQDPYRQAAELYVELIRLRQEITACFGYPDYPELAYDMYYSRNYYPAEALRYMQAVGEALYAPYLQLRQSTVWEEAYSYSSEADTYRFLRQATEAMGGIPAEAFGYMDRGDLHHITYGSNKLDSSFETYIWNYYAPFVFVNPYLDHTDKLTFAHEFGHFAADYVCDGTYAGTDIAEVHSQAMEYLTLCYGRDTELLTRYKLADSLCVYMEQSAYSVFEHQVYDLQGQELTVENVQALYEQVGIQFGFDTENWDPREYVTILHLYTDPMYMISYVVSNDLAMQFYQLELEKPRSGLELYEKTLTSQESHLLTFAEEYGLESPFAPERLEAVKALFSQAAI